MRKVDVVIVGASLAAAASAKRLTDAGLETIILERKELPRHKICSEFCRRAGIVFCWRISARCRAKNYTTQPGVAA